VVEFLRGVIHALGGIQGTVGYAVVLAILGALVYDHKVNAPKARVVQNRLRQEFGSITPLPGAVPGERSGSYKPRDGVDWLALHDDTVVRTDPGPL